MSTYRHPRRSHALLLFAVLSACATGAAAATLTWPNLTPFGPCRASLQACIDEAAPGDTVQIGVDDALLPDRYTAVNEQLSIRKSLTLRAFPGIDAVFAGERGIAVDPPAAATGYDVALEGLIFERGRVYFTDRSAVASVYRAERLRFNDGAIDQCALQGSAVAGTRPRFHFLRNSFRAKPAALPQDASICVGTAGSEWQVSIYGNRIEAPDGGLHAGIAIVAPGAGPINIANNVVTGRDVAFGILVQQIGVTGRMLLQVVNNSITGQEAEPESGAAGIRLSWNDADVQVVNNTVVHGNAGLVLRNFASASPVTGLVANNLVAHHRGAGLVIDAPSGVANRNNLVFANASDAFTPGPGTRTSDPQLISRAYPRPRDTSPALNAGSNSALPPFSGSDVDGQPRVMLATIDIGAYEAGYGLTDVHVASPDNAAFNQTDVATLGGAPLSATALLAVSPLHTPGDPLGLAQNLGVWLPNGIGNPPLSIFHQNTTVDIGPGRRFSVAVPGFGLTGFLHRTDGSNVSAQYTTLSNSELDARPDAIAVAVHNYLDVGPHHDQAIGMEYIGTRWNLRNEDLSVDMPTGRSFNVAVAPRLSENAWRVAAPASATREIALLHPLLDDNACAAPLVGRVDLPGLPVVFDSTAFSVAFRAGGEGAPGRWFIQAESGSAGATAMFPAGAAFNVILDGAQAGACRGQGGSLFRDGFE